MIATSKDQYHHGNLSRALKDEALRLIRERGIESMSLREVASAAGVSHAAPYHHFADRTALICALALEGMALMDARMAVAERAAGDDPSLRLLGIGMAYVEFAIERPDYYAAMSSAELGSPEAQAQHPEAEPGPTWMRLISAVVDNQKAGCLPAGDPVILAVSLWSLVHGLAELWRSGSLAGLPQASGGLEPLAREVLCAALGSMRAAAAEEVAK